MDFPHHDDAAADDLLRRALLDVDAAAAVALRVHGLPLSDTVTVIFHGRRDLGTLHTYVAPGGHGAGDEIRAADLLRVPCDLDLADAEDREEAELLYANQARRLRDALEAADTVLAVWRDPLGEFAETAIEIDRSVQVPVTLPAARLLPVALVAPERRLLVTPVCSARTLSQGAPPMGIACTQQDVTRVYPLPDDPERCIADFFAFAAEHAHRLQERIEHQDASIQRFLELNDDLPATS